MKKRKIISRKKMKEGNRYCNCKKCDYYRGGAFNDGFIMCSGERCLMRGPIDWNAKSKVCTDFKNERNIIQKFLDWL